MGQYTRYTANLCNQSVTEGQQIDAILANFLLLQLLFTILADLWLQIKSASFKCKNYTYHLLHLTATLLKENQYLFITCHNFIYHSKQLTQQSARVWCDRSWVQLLNIYCYFFFKNASIRCKYCSKYLQNKQSVQLQYLQLKVAKIVSKVSCS